MTVLLEGTGAYKFRVHTGRIEYDAIVDYVDAVPPEGLDLECLAVVVFDDAHVRDTPNGVAAGVMLKGPTTIPAGWFQWKQARQYRAEMAALGVDRSEAVLCRARLRGGAEFQFKKGPQRLCLHLWMDLAWPLRITSEWYPICAPYLRQLSSR